MSSDGIDACASSGGKEKDTETKDPCQLSGSLADKQVQPSTQNWNQTTKRFKTKAHEKKSNQLFVFFC